MASSSSWGVKGTSVSDSSTQALPCATTLPHFQPTERTIGSYLQTLKRATADLTLKHRSTITPRNLSSWYQASTPDQRRPSLPRRYDRQMSQLRTWCFAHRPWTCRACDEYQSPVHYLVQCPGQPSTRRRLHSLLRRQETLLTDSEKAALILRRSAYKPEILISLMDKQPYGATWGHP